MQKIKAKVPKNFVLVIEESFSNPSGGEIFVFKHEKTGKKLYCKLCDLEDIRKGFVWEVLTVEELKELNIEESYNAEVHEGKTGYVVEESNAGAEVWDPTSGESFEDYKKRMQNKVVSGEITKTQLEDLISGREVHLHIGGDNQGEGKSREELETENEDLRNKLTIIGKRRYDKEKAEAIARGADPSQVDTFEKFMEWKKNPTYPDPTSRPSSGTLTIEGQGSTGAGMSFDSQMELIQFLQRKIHSSKASPEEKREAQAVKNELWRKFLSGKKGKARNEGFDEIEDEGTPLFKKFYEEWRRREQGED